MDDAWSPCLWLAATEPAARSSIRLLVMLLLAVGIARCVQLALRPRTHAGAAIGLGLVLLGALGIRALTLVLGALEDADPPLRAAASVAGMTLAFLLVGAGVVTGLVSYVHLLKAAERYDQGRRQAVAAVLVGLALGAIMAFGAYSGWRERTGSADGPSHPPVSFQALNFRYVPPSGWKPIDLSKLAPAASAGYSRVAPHLFCAVLATETGTQLELDALGAVAKAGMASAASDVQVLSEAPHAIGPLRGVLVESRATVGKQAFIYWHWVHSHGGFLYQLMAWTLVSLNDDRARPEVLRAFQGFTLLDPDRLAPGELAGADEFASRYGYRTPARGRPWGRSPDETDGIPEAELVVKRGTTGYAWVVPLSLPGPAPSLQDLTAVYAELTNRRYPGAPLDSPRPIQRGAAEGWAFEFTEELDDVECAFHVWVLRAEGRAYLLQAWSAPPDEEQQAQARAFLEDIRFEPDVAPLAVEDMSPAERDRHARALRVLGDRAMDRRDRDVAEARYRAARAADPADVALLHCHLRSLSHARRYADAQAVLEAVPAGLRADRELRAWAGFLHARLGRDEQARADYAAAFAEGHRDVDDLRDFAAVLQRLEASDEAVAVVERFLAAGADEAAHLLLASVLRRAGRAQDAIAHLEPLVAERLTRPLAHGLVESYQAARRHREALELCARLTALELEDAETFAIRGRVHMALEQYAEARASFEEALRRDHPDDEEVRELLQQTAAALGEGDRASVSNPIEAVPPPAGWLEPVELPPDAREAGVFYAARLRAIRFRRGQEHTTTDYLRVAVLDDSRAAELNVFTFGFDPLHEAMFVNSVRVLDARGEVVATGQRATQYVRDDASRSSAPDQRKELHVPVPGVAAGRTIELVVSRRSLRPGDELGLVRWCLSRGDPIGLSAIEVAGDVAGLVAIGEHGAQVETTPTAVRCALRRPPTFRSEPFGAHYLTWLPTVTLADAGRSWEQLGRDYLARIARPLAGSAEAKALAASLLEGVPADERVAALASAVQERLTYRAVAFGVRASVPRTVPEVLESAAGDCKDHALLLHQLLREAGIASSLALVSCGGPVDPRVPSLEQFDHMVVSVGGRLIDPTDKHYALGRGVVPMALGGGHALVLDERPRLVRIDEYPPDSSRLVVERTVTPGGGLDLAVTERARFEGYVAAFLRDELAGLSEPARLQWAQDELARGGGTATVTSLVATGVKELAAPVVLELQYTLPGALQAVEGGRVGRLPAAWEWRHLRVSAQERRVSPFAVHYPLAVESTVRLRGEGVRLDAEDGDAPGPYVSHRAQVVRGEGEVTLTFSARRPSLGPQPPDRYAALVDASRAALDALRAPFRCR